MDGRKLPTTPRALRTVLAATELAEHNPCDGVRAISSYWSRADDADLQSLLVKHFKDPGPKPLQKPCLAAITRAYGVMLADVAKDWHPTAVLRVLSSSETRPDPERSQSLLVQCISNALDIPDFTHLFFRTEPRKPMRMIDRFAGPETLRQRIGYVLQDLFVTPAEIGGTVLIVDDIYNLGATARVYSAALKQFTRAGKAYSINIAAARFSGGRDGWGRLALDCVRFAELARTFSAPEDPPDAFQEVWAERNATDFHLAPDCPRIAGTAHPSVGFLAHPERVPCFTCASVSPKSAIRQWLQHR